MTGAPEQRLDARELAAAVVVAGAAVAALRFDAFTLPFFWDEVGIYAKSSYLLAKHDFQFTHEAKMEYIISHPPLYFLAIAATVKAAGWSVALVRAWGFAAGALYLSGAYALARHWLPRRASMMAAAALLCSPVVLSEIGMTSPDLPMAALGTWALFLLVRGDTAASSIVFGLGVATNATLFALAPAYALLLALRAAARGALPRALPSIALYFVPAAALLGAWAAVCHSIEGVLIPDRDKGQFFNWTHGLEFLLRRGAHRIVQLFLWDGRYASTFAIVAAGSLAWFRRRRPSPEVAALGALVAIEAAFLTFFGSTHQRYFLAALPALFVLGALALAMLVDGAALSGSPAPRWLLPALLGAQCALGAATWLGPADRFSPFEYRSAYRRHVELIQTAGAALSRLPPDTTVMAFWPVSQSLMHPYLGFVPRPLEVLDLSDDLALPRPTYGAVKKPAVLVLAHGASPLTAHQEQVIAELKSGLFSAPCESREFGGFELEICTAL